jgi:hypothetical protein
VSNKMSSMPVVYKITYPNGKIYVGCDMTDNVRYFGSANPELVAADLTPEQKLDFTARKQILWESATAKLADLLSKEREFILGLGSNDPAVGYNRSPKFKSRTGARLTASEQVESQE